LWKFFARQPHDVPTLVGSHLLKPLVNPPPHSVKYFAASELLERVQDRTWLAKVTNVLNQHWQKKNANKKNYPVNGSGNRHGPLFVAEAKTIIWIDIEC